MSGLTQLLGRPLFVFAVLALALSGSPPGFSQSSPNVERQDPAAKPAANAAAGKTGFQNEFSPGTANLGLANLTAWAGLRVSAIRFEGVSESTLNPLPGKLEQQPGEPLDPLKVRNSLRQLYETGLYETVEVAGVRDGDSVSIVFSGKPRLFFRRVNIAGVGNDRLANALRSAIQIQGGTAFSPDRVSQADADLATSLEENGFYRGQVARTTVVDRENALIDLNYTITTGPSARVGEVNVKGDSGLTEQEFRKRGKLKRDSRVNRNTVTRALTRLRKNYTKQGRLAATVSLTSKKYVPPVNHLNYDFVAERGPSVEIRVEGANVSRSELQKQVPVYEEGAVDQDLLNEGTRNLRNYFQSQGYFDTQVTHAPVKKDEDHIIVLYTVSLGRMHVVDSVSVTGNKYFPSDLITERISIRPRTLLDRHGVFSQQMLNQDVNSIKALYMSNGFTNVTVTPGITDLGDSGEKSKLSHLKVVYEIDEGIQQRVGTYVIEGIGPEQLAGVRPLLNTEVGQPFSTVNLNQDRDTVLTYFLSHGYDNVQVNLFQQPEADRKELVDVSMKVVLGRQDFVRQVVISGVHFTRRSVVEQRVLLHPSDPLNQTALLETQRKLYDLALFNEVNTAIQNPDGNETYKNVLLNLTEARRWDFNYGFGFEAQTGTPTEGCLSVADQALLGLTHYSCNPNGHFGVSPRVLFSISRTNLFGTNQSISLRTNYGTLEQLASLTYQAPDFWGNRNLTLSLSGGYNSSAYISTYQAQVLSSALRLAQRIGKADNVIYSFSYRRVSVNEATLQLSLAQIPLYAEPVRVGGPGITWLHDTRDVPLDAHHGIFTSVDSFLADSHFGSQANFARVDLTNATYYQFGRDHWVFARQTRYGQERAFGEGDELLIPLPERLYAGGPTSHRGFALNSAGPRDPQTGYPIGGAAVFVNTSELRMPPPELPYVGTNLSFVLFHDMGNAFENSSQVWPSFFRVRQPHGYTCRNVSVPYTTYNTPDTCDFNYFSHAVGLGLRYHTPVGPIRVDLSYNLNPPIYPVIYDYTTNSNTPNPHVGIAGNFNFFFSIGQSF